MPKPLPIPTSSDWVFKRIFGDEQHIESLKALLQTVLDLPEGELRGIQLLNPYTRQEHADDKQGILDVKLETACGKVINVVPIITVFDFWTGKMRFISVI